MTSRKYLTEEKLRQILEEYTQKDENPEQDSAADMIDEEVAGFSDDSMADVNYTPGENTDSDDIFKKNFAQK